MDQSTNRNTIKSRRRNAILKAAAVRMGFASWSDFETQFVNIILPQDAQPLKTDQYIRLQMATVLDAAGESLLEPHKPEDINQILIDHPRGKRREGVADD